MLYTESPIKTGRKVYTGYEVGVNYIVHLYTLANAGFSDEDYVKQFGPVVSPDDQEVLQENAKLISFLMNDGSPFSSLLYFIPCYYNFQTREEFEAYFQAWAQAIDEKDSTPLAPYSESGVVPPMFNVDIEIWRNNVLPNDLIFRKLGKVFTNNIDPYREKVWPQVEPVLNKRSQQMNEKLLSLPYIDRWEDATGYSFGGYDYFISFYYAGKNGPTFNDIGLYKNTVYYNKDTDYLFDMISHEVGIHILMPHLQELRNQYQREIPRIKSPHIYGNVSYMAFESLATFFNRKVLERQTCDIHSIVDPLAFLEIYDTLYQSGMTDPAQLYKQGVLEYIKPGGYGEIAYRNDT